MRQEFVNPFLSPALVVWEKEIKCELRLEKAESVSAQFTTEDVTAIIGVTGQLQGNVLYGFEQKTATSIASRLMGEQVEELDHVALSALGEIANMITGNAATLLAGEGYACEISPPVIAIPRGSTIATIASQQILVTFTSDIGALRIRIGLFERGRRGE